MRGKYELISAKSALTIKSNGLNLFLAVGILVRRVALVFVEQDGIRLLYGCWPIGPPRTMRVTVGKRARRVRAPWEICGLLIGGVNP
jgi:hypothetical protein